MCIDSAANNFVQSLSDADGYVTVSRQTLRSEGRGLESNKR